MKKRAFFPALIVLLVNLPNCCAGQVIVTYAGTGHIGYSGDHGPATIAEVRSPSGVVTDRYGNLFFTDQNASCVRKVDTNGIITTVAGNGIGGYFGDGGPATDAKMFWPGGLALDDSGDLFIADQFNNVIRKVNGETGIISTIAGNNTLIGYSGNGVPATDATLWHPADVAADPAGNVYFVDQDNSLLRKVDAVTGLITNVAGIPDTPGYSGDGGPASLAMLNFPQGVATDSLGNVYVADFYNNRIRKVDHATGMINTVAGNGGTGYTGDGGPATDAQIFYASALCIDDSGNMYISDYGNSRIRKVAALTGIISTVAGNGTADYCCDCNLATNAEIYFPQGVAADRRGNVFIADYGNARVREVTDSFYCPSLAIGRSTEPAPEIDIYPNPSDGQFRIKWDQFKTGGDYEIYNLLGQKVFSGEIKSEVTDVAWPGSKDGVYNLYINSGNASYVRKVIILR